MGTAAVAIARTVLVLIAITSSILFVEAGLRLTRHPRDYLSPVVDNDPILGIRLRPGTGGHDAWGFRNPEVPESVDVVALGDSQTWGVAARWEEAWPTWFSRMTGKSVYNFGIGGYGPIEYLYLLDTKALGLRPKRVIVGLYFGNDFRDVYFSVSLRRHWAAYRTASMPPYPDTPPPGTASSALPAPEQLGRLKRLRTWLRRNSMLFRIIEEGPIGQRINAYGDRTEGLSRVGCVVTLDEPFPTVLHPEYRFGGMDLGLPAVSEGLDITLGILDQMAMRVAQSGAEFLVVLLPTKVSVLMGGIEHPADECEQYAVDVIAAESILNERVRAHFDERGIAWVDPLEAMRAAALVEPIYLRSADSHPNGQGYRVIAEQIVEAIGGSTP